MRIAFVPLDNRPCNFEQVQELARIARIDLRTPPASAVGGLQPGDHAGLRAWLDREFSDCDALVISLDQYLYGGLVASRKRTVTPEECELRLSRLRRLIDSRPAVPIYVTNILLRLSVTVTADVGEQVWRDVFQFSVLSDPAHPSGAGKHAELESLRERIPAGILEEYLGVRARNHAVNREALRFAERAGFVLIGQEDCAEFGLHRPEKLALEALRAETLSASAQARSLVLTGADELGAMSVARAFADSRGIQPRSMPLEVDASSLEDLERVSKYEDISARRNIELHFAPSQFALNWSPHTAAGSTNPRLRIAAFGAEGQDDLCFRGTDAESESIPSTLEAWAKETRSTDAFLDLRFGNGASPALLRSVLSATGSRLPSALSAWNTTGNRAGTLVAQLSLRTAAKASGDLDPEADRFATWTRVLDDGLYQGVVRARLTEIAKARSLDPWALGSAHWEFSKLADSTLHAVCQEWKLSPPPFRAQLPWPRLFEISLRWGAGDQTSG